MGLLGAIFLLSFLPQCLTMYHNPPSTWANMPGPTGPNHPGPEVPPRDMMDVYFKDDDVTTGRQPGKPDNSPDFYQTNSYVPRLPSVSGFMGTHGHFMDIREQTAVVMGDGKHGIWRIQENGMIRNYRRQNTTGVRNDTDPNALNPQSTEDAVQLRIIENNYAPYIPEEDTSKPGPELGTTNWGSYSQFTSCPGNKKVIGFKQQVAASGQSDETGLNGIQLICEGDEETSQITGPFGTWASSWTKCPTNEYVIEVALKSMGAARNGVDDFGATNVAMKCSGGSRMEGSNGLNTGDWGSMTACDTGYVCGVRAKIQGDMDGADDTGLNKLQLSCCNEGNSKPGPELGTTNWGSYSQFTRCPDNKKVIGFKQQVEEAGQSDETGLNGIQLICEGDEETSQITGPFGTWASSWTKCPSNEYVTEVALKSMGAARNGVDDFGATNVAMKCSGGSRMEGSNGLNTGNWGSMTACDTGYVCGVRAKIQDNMRGGDDTGLNKLQLSCCNEGWNGYKYPDEHMAEDGFVNWVDLTIYHHKYDGKYEHHVPIDLPHWYSTMTQNDYPNLWDAWKYAVAQPQANKMGPLARRAGLDIEENYHNVLRFDFFQDAGIWSNVGVGNATDKVVKDLEELKERFQTVNYERVDLSKMDYELYLFERPFFNKPYIFISLVLNTKPQFQNATKGEFDYSYLRPHGAYYDELVKRNSSGQFNYTLTTNNVSNHFPEIFMKDYPMEGDNSTETVFGLPTYGHHHARRLGEQQGPPGGACPSRGGDWGRYPWGNSGSGWPTNLEEVTPLCDGVVIDVKMWLNLQVPSWTDKQLFQGNAGFDGALMVNYTMDGNIFGEYTDPYLKSINATNPYQMNFSENGTIIEADDRKPHKVTYQLKFSRPGTYLGYNNISVREGQARVEVKKDDYERMVRKMEEMEDQMRKMKGDGNYTDKDQIKLHNAEQSSTETRFGCQGNDTCDASMATDGNMTTGSVTKYTSFSWWKAEMEKLVHVDAVMVYTNSWAVQQGYFRRFKVETKMREWDEWTVCKDEHSIGSHDPHIVQCDRPTTGKYVRVSVTPSGSCVPLYLDEVKVIGRPSVARPGGPKMVLFPSINMLREEEMTKLEYTDADVYVKTVGYSQVAGKDMHAGVMLFNPGPALEYVHSYESMMLVMNGSFTLHHNGTTYNITQGQSMYMPRGARVSYKSRDGEPARMFFVMQPTSIEMASPIQMAMERNPRIKIENTTDSLYPNIKPMMNEMDNSSSYFVDMFLSKVNGSEMTGGLYKLPNGKVEEFTFQYEEFQYVVRGRFDLTDGTGQNVVATAGDLVYFPKKAFVHWTAPQSALGFYVGQRG